MALETDFNKSPYFDDYKDVAEGKDYHRVLFKPGLAVQTRELTQLQSMIYEQIARFGDNIFKEGTVVEGCAFQYDANVAFVRLQDKDPGANTVDVTVFANGIVTGLQSGVRAKVVAAASGTQTSVTGDSNVLLVKYLNGGTVANSSFNGGTSAGGYKTFAFNETISFLPADGGSGQLANTYTNGTGINNPFGFGSIFHIGDGTVFGKGHFVTVRPQTLILEKFSTRPSYKVGFKINESVVTSDNDTTLLDNARGSYNYTAPGADRLKLTANLTKKVLETANTESFLPIFEVDSGSIRTIKNRTVYDVLGDMIAERTYDESGNYEIKKMKVAVKEHYDNGTNFGRWAAGSIRPVANTQRLAIGVEAGEAYVQGYHNEHLATVWIDADKGIDTRSETGVTVSTSYSNFVDCKDVIGTWDPTTYQTVELHGTAHEAWKSSSFGGASGPGNQIGTAKLKFVQYRSGTPSLRDGTYRFYLFDIKMTSGTFASVKSIYVNNASGPDNFANIVLDSSGNAVLTEPSFNRSLFKSGLSYVKSFGQATYKYRDKASVTMQTNGQQTLTLGTPHTGGNEELDYSGTLTQDQRRTITAVNLSSPVKSRIPGNVGITNSSNTITFDSNSSFSSVLSLGDFIELDNGTSQEIVQVLGNLTSTTADVSGAGLGLTSATNGILRRVYPTGHIFDLGGAGATGTARTVTATSATELAINMQETYDSTFTMGLHYNAQRETANAAIKLVRKNRFIKLDLSTNDNGTNGPWVLGFPDVFNIRKVYLGTTYATTNRDVTRDFYLIRNATDTLYNLSQIALRPNSILNLTTSDRLLVELDYFEHNESTGIGFFNVESYQIDPAESRTNSTTVATSDIPVFDSQNSGEEYELRDTIDFRPHVYLTATDTTSIGSATVNPSSNNSIDVPASGSYVPLPSGTWEADGEYYLARIDRVVIGKDGKKRVVRGVPNEKPFPPAQPAESMSLALLSIPPYPSLSQEHANVLKRRELAVQMKPIINKRYTMKDIAALDQRIGNLEYYTALSILEKAATDLQISDDNGLNRFKNGIFVDSFYGHNFADTTNVAYSACIDSKKGEFRPRFEQYSIDLGLDNVDSNIARKGKHVRLTVSSAVSGYSAGDTVYVGATLGSSSARGTVRAVVSTGSNAYRLYLHNTTGTFGATETLKNDTGGGTGTIDSVQGAVTTDALMMSYTHQTYVLQPWATNLVNPVTELQFEWVGNMVLTPEADHWNDVTTLPEVNFSIDLAGPFEDFANAMGTNWQDWSTTTSAPETEVTTEFTVEFDPTRPINNPGRFKETTTTTTTTTTISETIKEGIRVNVDPFENTQSTGPFVSEVGTVPFIRSREVAFSATGMRPDTTVYPFFEDTDVSDYVTPTGGVEGGTLTTDSNGSVSGIFLIPNNDTLKFRVGQRRFKLIDIQDLIIEKGNATTSASAEYNASGLTVSQRGISLTTREPIITAEPVTEVVTDVNVTSEVDTDIRFHDPVAQTFVIGEFEYVNPNASSDASGTGKNFGIGADGVFVSAIDIFFERTPNNNNGIAVEIREVHNGEITSIRVPFGYKRVERTDVNTSSNGQAPTPFYFDAPVYLRGGREYCFIVKPDGNDPGYRCWTAQLGGTDVFTGAIVDQQPAVGMMFTSANDRTYSPRQKEDMKFRIWRASFVTGVNGVVTLTNQSDEYLKVTQASGNFRIGESVVGESIFTTSSSSDHIQPGDKIYFGANVGIIRQVVSNTASISNPTVFKADIAGIPNSTVSLVSQGTGNTYSAVIQSQTSNTIAGTVQFYNPSSGELVIDSSVGGFTSNTTSINGFIRGLTSNNTAQMYYNKDFKYNLIAPRLSIAQYVDTNVGVKVKTYANTGAAGSFVDISRDGDHAFYDSEKIVYGKTHEVDEISSNKSLTIQSTMSTNVDRLSPIFDLGRAKSLILVKNIVNNTANNEFGNYGLANCKYISKKIILADGQDAEDMKIILDAYRPKGTDVQVWIRIQNQYDSEDFSDKYYTKLVATNKKKRDSSTTNKDDFIEMEFNVPTTRDATTLEGQYSAVANTNNNSVVDYRLINSDVWFSGYKTVSVKIVLLSEGSNLIPRVRALRAIALQR